MSRPYAVKNSQAQRIGRFHIVMDTLDVGGREAPYSYIREKDFVCVLPLCEGDVIYLRQYRHAVDCWKLELPCGVIEEGEEPEQTVERELLEETGYHTKRLVSLGHLHAKAGTSTATVYLFAAYCGDPQEQSLDLAERIDICRTSECEFSRMVSTGVFDQIYGIVTWYRYRDSYGRKDEETC